MVLVRVVLIKTKEGNERPSIPTIHRLTPNPYIHTQSPLPAVQAKVSDATPLYLPVQAGACPTSPFVETLTLTFVPPDFLRTLIPHHIYTDGSKGSVLSHADVLQKNAWPVVSGVLSKQLIKIGL